MLEMKLYLFRFLFNVADSGDSLEARIDRVAEVLHGWETVSDVSIGADREVGEVEIEVAASGRSPQEAFHTAHDAVRHAIWQSGEHVLEFLAPSHSEPHPMGERWRQRGAELVDA